MRHFVSVADLTREDVLHLFEVLRGEADGAPGAP